MRASRAQTLLIELLTLQVRMLYYLTYSVSNIYSSDLFCTLLSPLVTAPYRRGLVNVAIYPCLNTAFCPTVYPSWGSACESMLTWSWSAIRT